MEKKQIVLELEKLKVEADQIKSQVESLNLIPICWKAFKVPDPKTKQDPEEMGVLYLSSGKKENEDELSTFYVGVATVFYGGPKKGRYGARYANNYAHWMDAFMLIGGKIFYGLIDKVIYQKSIDGFVKKSFKIKENIKSFNRGKPDNEKIKVEEFINTPANYVLKKLELQLAHDSKATLFGAYSDQSISFSNSGDIPGCLQPSQ